LYFLLADMHNKFKYLQTGLAFILAFVGVKMIIAQAFDYHMPMWLSLGGIGAILAVSIGASLLSDPDPDDDFPHQLHDDPGPGDDAVVDAAVAEAVADATDDDASTDPRVTGT